MQITQRRSTDHPELADRITAHLDDLQGIIKQIRNAAPNPHTALPSDQPPDGGEWQNNGGDI